MSDYNQLVKIQITGIGELQTFTNLSIQQSLADVCYGSFGYREEGKTTLQHQVDFYKQLMGQELEISVHQSHSFKGYITTVSLQNENEEASEYLIQFSGLMGKLAYHKECNSWRDKTLNGIIKEVAQQAPIDADDKDTDALHYTVQYNQTTFDFIRFMATRHGKWFYYNGERMMMKPPTQGATPIVFRKGQSIFNISIMARNAKGHDQFTGFDLNTGKDIAVSAQAPQTEGMLAAASGGARNAFNSHETGMHLNNIDNEAHGKEFARLQNESAAASSVVFQAISYNSEVKLGAIIQIDESDGSTGKTYIVTQLVQSSSNPDNYTNYLTFIPGDVTVPPYTDPDVMTRASAQPAIVKDNEDDGGIDRMKVHFPWMKATETTDWLSMVTPYAGKNKGMRFLPEKEEEVLVDFIGGNIEKPYIVGAIFTEANKSLIVPKGNHIKGISTGSGRRFEIDDDKGNLLMYDNYTDKMPKNAILMQRKDSDIKTLIESQKDGDNYSVIVLNNQDYINLGLVSGGALIAEIRLEKDGKKIIIKSEGSIDLQAKDSITMSAANIKINADQELKISGEKKGVSVDGQKLTVGAKTSTEINGVNVKISASAKLDLSGGAMASLSGALVKIN